MAQIFNVFDTELIGPHRHWIRPLQLWLRLVLFSTFGRCGARKRGIELAAEDEDRRQRIKKNQRNHHRREPRIGRNVIARAFGKIRAESDTEA